MTWLGCWPWVFLQLLFWFCAESSLTEFYELAGWPWMWTDAKGPQCHSGFCSSVKHYPVQGTFHYAEFNVPELPKSIGKTFFVYYNIDWQAAGPSGSDARMNQFVPQLMLGYPLDSSTGPPAYKPLWHERKSWVFGAQYFFEIFNETANATQAKAATGETYSCEAGEQLFTSFTLGRDWVWTLQMGVLGDPSRVSTLVVEKPFMGLLPSSQTISWSEPVYAAAWSNTCWELKGVFVPSDYPQSDQRTTVTISNPEQAIPWGNWSTGQPTCPGAPKASIIQSSSAHHLRIILDVNGTHPSANTFVV